MEGLSSWSERSQRMGLNNTESKKVGITESYNGPGQGGLDIPELKKTSAELSSMEGRSSRNECLQKPTLSKDVGITESYISGNRVIAEEISSQLKKTLAELSSMEGLNSSKNKPSTFSNNTVEAGADTKNVTITRTTFSNNTVEAGAEAENVGMTECFNRPDLGGLDVSNNKVTAGERAKRVGVYNVGNTRPDAAN